MKFELEKLPYSVDALEPVMDRLTVEIHYLKHHQAYLNNLNTALLKYPDIETDIVSLLKQIESLPADIQSAVKNNGGGYYNHTLFWSLLSPNKNQKPTGKLLEALTTKFGSYEKFKEEFITAGTKHFGSGWVWLVKLEKGSLEIMSLSNQDTPLAYGTPILALDLWEHAYYLKYQNRRVDYLNNIWQIINWDYAEKLYNE